MLFVVKYETQNNRLLNIKYYNTSGVLLKRNHYFAKLCYFLCAV